jgi:hypothetical protein
MYKERLCISIMMWYGFANITVANCHNYCCHAAATLCRHGCWRSLIYNLDRQCSCVPCIQVVWPSQSCLQKGGCTWRFWWFCLGCYCLTWFCGWPCTHGSGHHKDLKRHHICICIPTCCWR